MLSPDNGNLLLDLIYAVANHETDYVEADGIRVARGVVSQPHGENGITVTLNPFTLDLEPEDEND